MTFQFMQLVLLTLQLCKTFQKDGTRPAIHQPVSFNIFELLENSDRHLFDKLKRSDHPLHSLLPRNKDSSARVRNRSSIGPNINTERFKDSF